MRRPADFSTGFSMSHVSLRPAMLPKSRARSSHEAACAGAADLDKTRPLSSTRPAALLSMPDNPLLAAWLGPDEVPPFGRIAPKHFRPAFERAMARSEERRVGKECRSRWCA